MPIVFDAHKNTWVADFRLGVLFAEACWRCDELPILLKFAPIMFKGALIQSGTFQGIC